MPPRQPRRDTGPADESVAELLAAHVPQDIDPADEIAVTAAVDAVCAKYFVVQPSLQTFERICDLIRARQQALGATLAGTVALWVIGAALLPLPVLAASLPLPTDEYAPLRVIGYGIAGLIVGLVLFFAYDAIRTFVREQRAPSVEHEPHPSVHVDDLAQ